MLESLLPYQGLLQHRQLDVAIFSAELLSRSGLGYVRGFSTGQDLCNLQPVLSFGHRENLLAFSIHPRIKYPSKPTHKPSMV